ncbi:MAG: alpha/beta fold hydrolase BchO [Pseudomonadota bacterium]
MLMAPAGPSWRALSRVWPHSDASRFVEVGSMRWHVQDMGREMGQECTQAPTLLLIHGAGASTHSWRAMMPALAEHFRVIAIDLPGHGFSGSPPVYRPTLPRVSRLLGELLDVLDADVKLVVGHSAGAAIGAWMALQDAIKPAGLVAFNGAFKPFDGAAGTIFPALAKLLFVNPLTPRLLAIGGRDATRVERLIEGTGSTLDEDATKYYKILMGSPGHVSGVLAMMANWDLEPLVRKFPDLACEAFFIASSKDRAVLPAVSKEQAGCIARASYEEWEGLGHLAHEEAPERAAERVMSFARTINLLE